MVLKIERFQPKGMNVRMSAGKPSYSHVVTVSGRWGNTYSSTGLTSRRPTDGALTFGSALAWPPATRQPRR